MTSQRGILVNPDNGDYADCVKSKIFVDKSALINLINERIGDQSRKFICMSRPRRFGKTFTAHMLSAYYSKGCDSKGLFDKLAASGTNGYHEHLNAHNVIKINVQYFLSRNEHDVKRMIDDWGLSIIEELTEMFPKKRKIKKLLTPPAAVCQLLNEIYKESGEKFVFILDEWDCVMREIKEDERSQKEYLDFLRMIFKDQPYVSLVYMTGILPIKKYGTHSALNMFDEISMTESQEFYDYVGFTENEVKQLCRKFKMKFSEIKLWYDGYTVGRRQHIFNPNSVVKALDKKVCLSYWTNTETVDALLPYIELPQNGLKEAVLSLLSGDELKISVGTFRNDMTSLKDRDEVLTLLVHLGYLSAAPTVNKNEINNRMVRIPNLELRNEFEIIMKQSEVYGEAMRMISDSNALFEAIWNHEEEKVASLIDRFHMEYSSVIKYNDENSLACVLTVALFRAHDYYTRIFELPSGNGFADVAFIPKKKCR